MPINMFRTASVVSKHSMDGPVGEDRTVYCGEERPERPR
jgi:hypothetical protein